MIILHSPMSTIFYLAALLLTVTGSCCKKMLILLYIGGCAWVAGTLAALLTGVSLREILVVTLLLLSITVFSDKGEWIK